MAQKFVSLEEAAKQLGVSKDRLTELREGGKVRAYRDGAGWKFRADDVEKLSTEGLPPEGSDISLGADDSEEPSELDIAGASDITLESSDIEFDLGDEGAANLAEVSDVSLEDLDEPTVPVDMPADDETLDIGLDNELDELSDSILLSEAELGPSTDRPPSTIIGKAEMAADLDLELAASDSDLGSASDTKLAGPASNVFSPGRGDAVLDTEPPSLSDNFGEIEELEIDLEAESSRILSPEDVSKAKLAAASKSVAAKAAEISDLELAPYDSNAPVSRSGGVLDSVIGGGGGLSGLSALELEGDDDDEVLGEGSDITLSSESSGINIISPSDSGLALDEVPLELSGASAIGSSLDLGAGDDMVLEPIDHGPTSSGVGKAGEPFALTPFGEEAGDDEEDSSQIIPLDEVSEDEAGPLLGVGESESLGDDFATAGLATGPMAYGEPTEETPFSAGIVAVLGICTLLITICGMMTFDLLRNMWSWDEVYSINSTLLEMVNPFLS